MPVGKSSTDQKNVDQPTRRVTEEVLNAVPQKKGKSKEEKGKPLTTPETKNDMATKSNVSAVEEEISDKNLEAYDSNILKSEASLGDKSKNRNDAVKPSNKSPNQKNMGDALSETSEQEVLSSDISGSSESDMGLFGILGINKNKKSKPPSGTATQKYTGKSVSDQESSSSDYPSYNSDNLKADVATFNKKSKNVSKTIIKNAKPSTSGIKKAEPRRASVTFEDEILSSPSSSTPYDSWSSEKSSNVGDIQSLASDKAGSSESKTGGWFGWNKAAKEPQKAQNNDASNDNSEKYKLASDKADVPSKIEDTKNKPSETVPTAGPVAKLPDEVALPSKNEDTKSKSSKTSPSTGLDDKPLEEAAGPRKIGDTKNKPSKTSPGTGADTKPPGEGAGPSKIEDTKSNNGKDLEKTKLLNDKPAPAKTSPSDSINKKPLEETAGPSKIKETKSNSSNESKTGWLGWIMDYITKEPQKAQNDKDSSDSSEQYKLASDKPFPKKTLPNSDLSAKQPTEAAGPGTTADTKSKSSKTSPSTSVGDKSPSEAPGPSKTEDNKSNSSKESSLGKNKLANGKPTPSKTSPSSSLKDKPPDEATGPSKYEDTKSNNSKDSSLEKEKFTNEKPTPAKTSPSTGSDVKPPDEVALPNKVGDTKSNSSKDSSIESKTGWFNSITNNAAKEPQKAQNDEDSNDSSEQYKLASDKPFPEKTLLNGDLSAKPPADAAGTSPTGDTKSKASKTSLTTVVDDKSPNEAAGPSKTEDNKSSSSKSSSLESNKAANEKPRRSKTSPSDSMKGKSSDEATGPNKNEDTKSSKSKDSSLEKKKLTNEKPTSEQTSLRSEDKADEPSKNEDSKSSTSKTSSLGKNKLAKEKSTPAKTSPNTSIDGKSPEKSDESGKNSVSSNDNKDATMHEEDASGEIEETSNESTKESSALVSQTRNADNKGSFTMKKSEKKLDPPASKMFPHDSDIENIVRNDKMKSISYDSNPNIFSAEPSKIVEDEFHQPESEEEIMNVGASGTIGSGTIDSFIPQEKSIMNPYPCGHKCRSNCHPGPCPNTGKCTKKVKIACACKRLKKEFPCEVVRKNSVIVDCDEECIQKQEAEKKQQEALAIQKRKEEELKNQKELEKYQKMFEGKRKNRGRRVRGEEEDEQTFMQKYWQVFVWLSGILLSIAIYALYS